MKTPIKCSVGITAYNEGKNISRILNALLRQKLHDVIIDEILVISSGSIDDTNNIVKESAKKDKRIKLTVESKRKGKASAVNIFIDNAKNEILVLESADTIPDKNTIERMVRPFKNDHIGITGSHPIPINSKKTLVGYAVHCMWDLHHQISLNHPKMGEMIAFRKSFKKIPVLSAVDEVNIEALIKGQGYKSKYIAHAIVRNKGPETLKEYISQRRRIAFGHVATKIEHGYKVSTFSGKRALYLMIKNLAKVAVTKPLTLPKEILFSAGTAFLEVYVRILGIIDYRVYKKNYAVWKIASSTKDLRIKVKPEIQT